MTAPRLPRLDDIRARLNAATPGPWKYGGMIGDPGKPLAHFVTNAKGDIVSLSTDFAADYAGLDKDQRFIASAPEDIAFLLALVEEKETEVARLLGVLDDFAHAAHSVLEGDSYVGTTPEMVAAARHRLAVFAGKYNRPVSAAALVEGREP